MNYEETIEYLYNAAPLFQNLGAGAYKEGLENTYRLDEHFGHPHRKYRTIHVAGTNGKGSTSHTLAAILQSQGYKVGLYTSPHLIDFRERIRVNGNMIPKERVIKFVEDEHNFFEPLHPSFFELATAMAFQYFAEEQVDWAIIEVGLGGRLDCTNIISPTLSIITNISFDHIQFLGDTLTKIASEKAGIIKTGIPVVIGEAEDKEVRDVFLHKALDINTAIYFAENYSFSPLENQLKGFCQEKNSRTIRTAIKVLQDLGISISDEAIAKGFAHVCELTGLMGRWQTIAEHPLVICDTGHNIGGWQYIVQQLESIHQNQKLNMIVGMVNDKDVNHVLAMMPKNAHYYFTQASVKRAMPANEFAAIATRHGLVGKIYPSVEEAYTDAKAHSGPEDIIFVGGSTFIVADFIKMKGK